MFLINLEVIDCSRLPCFTVSSVYTFQRTYYSNCFRSGFKLENDTRGQVGYGEDFSNAGWGQSNTIITLLSNPNHHGQDGFITAKDLKNFFLTFQRKLTDDDVKKILNDGDANGDNKIELSEFIDIMSKS